MKTDHKLTQIQNQGIIWPLIRDGTGTVPYNLDRGFNHAAMTKPVPTIPQPRNQP